MLVWHQSAWQEYTEWYETDKNKFKRLNQLIKDVMRSPFEGIGKPEPLKGDLSGFWSRRIDEEHRLVYRVMNGNVEIAQCKGHY